MGIALSISIWKLLKSYSDHLKIDPNLYAKYHNPSSGSSQDIVLTSFFSVATMTESKRGITYLIFHRICTKIDLGI